MANYNLEVSYGYGSGDGYGSGYGDGDGYGSGYGYGSADGYGYGSGDGSYLESLASSYAPKRIEALTESGVVYAFWRSGKDGKPANGGQGPERKAGDIEEIAGPLAICTAKALHGTFAPHKWEGERLWIVALYPPVATQGDKVASLKREIIAEIIPNPYGE